MKKKILFSLLIMMSLGISSLKAQEIYNTTSGEIIFGWSDAKYTAKNYKDDGAGDIQDAVRFTVWFHLYSHWHFDFSNKFGLYTGLGNRNIGFITKEMSSEPDAITDDHYMVKWKRRSYALGVPLAIKLGNFSKGFYIFGGAQMEWLYHYKEKEFLTSGKRKNSEWWSDRVNTFLPSAFVGVAFPHGLNIKFTYALDDFMNKSYTDAAGNQPYKFMDSKIMYVSVFQSIRWNKETYIVTENKKKPKIAIL